ncbi:putative bifunctional diguanylate cyclase/phosphodiesterase [Solicola sp. PLA-1-18]|uniref:putative bifunctional diguanylate cyclase/phosphodiesterase n=1 Tax=Solicola sp. PLA-1-18 TaxID=3380532 RepID=UPI003B76BD89
MSLVRRCLPSGWMLPAATWRRRHQVVVAFALVQAAAVVAWSLTDAADSSVVMLFAVLSIGAGVISLLPDVDRTSRCVLASAGLASGPMMLASVPDVGAEAPFVVLVVVAVVTLYQDWRSFGLVVVSSVVFYLVWLRVDGLAALESSGRSPWLAVGTHAAVFLAAVAASLAAWRLNEDAALRDAVTGLGNRVHFHQLTTTAARGRDPFGIVFIDLDEFKAVNDTHGHDVGDRLLAAVAGRLSACLRGSDTLARLGGDEFAAVVHARPDQVATAAARMLRALDEPVVLDGIRLHVGASMGVAGLDVTRRSPDLPAGARSRGAVTSAQTTRDVTALLRDADVALYAAKGQGKRCVVVYADGMTDTVRRRSNLQQDLRGAADRGEIGVHFQPIVELATSRVVGYEALARWDHPQLGSVSPAEFIAWAEADRSIGPLGALVLDTAVARAAQWSSETGRPIEMGVNVSPVQLATPGWVETVRHSLRTHGLPAAQLTVEVTENIVAHRSPRAVEALAELRAEGVRIAVDDFGTGYSNFEYVRRLPVDVIKIDRSFVTDAVDDRTTATVVSAIIALADVLGARVVAEGIETAEQEQALLSMGCGHAQGYRFARPAPGPQHQLTGRSAVPA